MRNTSPVIRLASLFIVEILCAQRTPTPSVKGGKDSIAFYENLFLTHIPPEATPHFRGGSAVFTDEPTATWTIAVPGGWWDPLSITWQTSATAQHKVILLWRRELRLHRSHPFSLGQRMKNISHHDDVVRTCHRSALRNPEKDAMHAHPSECCATSAELGDPSESAYQWKHGYGIASVSKISRHLRILDQHYDDLLKKSSLFRDTFYSIHAPRGN